MNNEDNVIKSLNNSLSIVEENFEKELHTIRTGRASSNMLNNINVEAYGVMTPLNQIASIVVIDAQMLQVTPYDPNNLNSIITSIRNHQELGLNPSDDGRVVRLAIPPLTEERRTEIAKQIGQKMEETMIKIRNLRHESINKIEQSKKDKNIGEDDAKRYHKQIDEIINASKSKIEVLTKQKEKEVMSL